MQARIPALAGAIGVAGSLTASAYLLLVPLWFPRGPYLHGRYALSDILWGVPLALAALAGCLSLAAGRERRPRVAHVLASWWLAIVGGVLLFDLAVAGRRVVSLHMDLQHDPELAWSRRPGANWEGRSGPDTAAISYTADEFGFRNKKGLERADVVFVGDSFTEAMQIQGDLTFVHRVERATGLTVANLGRSGYGPQQELAVLELYAGRYRPAFIVWQMFEGNDLDDVLRYSSWLKAPTPALARLAGDYAAASPVRRWLDSTVPMVAARLRHQDGTSTRFRIESGLCPEGADRQRAERLLLETLTTAARFARLRNARLIVVSIPNGRTVLGPYLEDPESGRPLPVAAAPCEGLGQVVETALGKSVAAVIDTTDAFVKRASIDNKRLFFAWDQHMDVDGHAVVAAQIVDWLRRAGAVENSFGPK